MTAVRGGGWSVVRRAGTARTLHEAWPPARQQGGRVVGLCSVRGGPAIVLGSTQRTDSVDAGRAAQRHTDVVRRGSGGGAVVVAPDAQVWVDVWLPRGDALWDDDVLRSPHWLGTAWARALGALGARDLEVHAGRATGGPWAGLVCFAGVGPGEVTTAGIKVVGVAQRRVRAGARLHSVALLVWQPSTVVELLALGADDVTRAEGELAGAATGLRPVLPDHGDGRPGAEVVALVEDAVVATLP